MIISWLGQHLFTCRWLEERGESEREREREKGNSLTQLTQQKGHSII